MTQTTETINRITLVCDECGTQAVYENREARPAGWVSIQHPNWDLDPIIVCSKDHGKAVVLRAIDAL